MTHSRSPSVHPYKGDAMAKGEHRGIFAHKSINNLFMHPFHCSFNNSFHNIIILDLSMIFGNCWLIKEGNIGPL